MRLVFTRIQWLCFQGSVSSGLGSWVTCCRGCWLRWKFSQLIAGSSFRLIRARSDEEVNIWPLNIHQNRMKMMKIYSVWVLDHWVKRISCHFHWDIFATVLRTFQIDSCCRREVRAKGCNVCSKQTTSEKMTDYYCETTGCTHRSLRRTCHCCERKKWTFVITRRSRRHLMRQ